MDKKFALITGASSGIGRAYAMKFASLGYSLLLIARNENKLNEVANEIQKLYDVLVEVIHCDLSDEKQITDVESIIIPNRNILVLVNNAGFGLNDSFNNTPIEKSLSMINVHLIATVKFTKAILPKMIKSNHGIIINVSSLGSLIKLPNNLIYSATKSFLNTFSEHLKLELINTDIMVQAICPGYTKSDFYRTDEFKNIDLKDVPDNLWMTPDALVEKSMKALSDKRVIYIPGFWNKAAVVFKNFISYLMINKIHKLNNKKAPKTSSL